MQGMQAKYDVRCPCGWNGWWPNTVVQELPDGKRQEFQWVPAIDSKTRRFRPGPYCCPKCHHELEE